MTFKSDDQTPESFKVRWELVPYTRGKGLDLSLGAYRPFKHFIGPEMIGEVTKLSVFASGSLDFVYSSHTLDCIDNTKETLKEWWRVVKTGGYLVLYLPHKNFSPLVRSKEAKQQHAKDFLPEDIIKTMESVGTWDLVRNEERSSENEHSFFQVYKKQGKFAQSYKITHEKTCAVIRYGGFGDMIQAASVLAALKKQGWYNVLYCSERGVDTLKHDPNIDEFVVQDTDQVPNNELDKFWEHVKNKHDKFVNLSESVEGSLLAIPGRTAHAWGKEARHAYMNHNYLEMSHQIAGVPFEPGGVFHSTQFEKEWAKKEKKGLGTVVVWSLAGSSVHKTWPYLDNVLACIMLETDWHVFLVGDHLCKLLEIGWEKEKRVHRKSGEWTIRQTLSFLEVCDLVVGSETGVLNAAGMLEVQKIVCLSHSTDENLTKHWKNTTALVPDNTPCYPCHMMHYNFDHCSRDFDKDCEACKTKSCSVHTGVAKCQANISADQMWSAIVETMEGRQRAMA